MEDKDNYDETNKQNTTKNKAEIKSKFEDIWNSTNEDKININKKSFNDYKEENF